MGLMANLRQFSSIFRRKCQKNAVFHRKKPAIGGKCTRFSGKKSRTGPLRLQSGRGGSRRSRALFRLRRRETGRMPNKGLILFVIREK